LQIQIDKLGVAVRPVDENFTQWKNDMFTELLAAAYKPVPYPEL
jgi:hypothetical protein